MFERIVVAYDGKNPSKIALKQAASLASAFRAELSLVGVVSMIPSTAMADPYPQDDFLSAGRGRLQQSLEKEVLALQNMGIRVTAQILAGNPASEIASYAKSVGADLVVVGHSERGLLTRWFEGSTGSRLIRDIPCSLLIASGE